jgi:hypothetical protein
LLFYALMMHLLDTYFYFSQSLQESQNSCVQEMVALKSELDHVGVFTDALGKLCC